MGSVETLDILIVGAGPVGLTLALDLGRRGIRSTIVERDSSTDTGLHAKASVIDERTMKWGCERMLNKTIQQHPDRFRTMVVRLGQIAGSKTSGYWNPMEHFGFLIKSSQTLNALPDVPGTVYWTL